MTDINIPLGPADPTVMRHTASQAVANALREAILAGSLPAGSRLIQATLARHFGVSSTPVREALRQLAAEGLVRFDSYRGAVIMTSTLDDIREVWDLMMRLEPVAIRKADHRITQEELTRLRDLHEQMSNETEVGHWLVLNREFHELLQQAAHAPQLIATLNSLNDVAGFHTAITIRKNERNTSVSNAEHAQIVEALEQRDADAAVRVITAQLQRSLEALEENIARSDGRSP